MSRSFHVLVQRFDVVGRKDACEALWDMARDSQLRDSVLLDQLVCLARTGAQPVPRNLAVVAGEYVGLHINKDDPYRKRYAEIRGQVLNQVERGFLDYAIKDAIATIHAYAGLADTARSLMDRHIDLYDPDLAARYGSLTEAIQVKAAIALATISRNGMHVDADRMAEI